MLALRRLAAEYRPDVMQLHDPHALSAGLFVGAGPRRIATRRVDFPVRSSKYARVERVVAVSRAIADVLAAGGVDEGRVRVVYEGVPDRPAQPGGRELLASLGVPKDAPVIGNVAALTDHKDHATLIEAMAVLPESARAARLVIFGEGELRAALEARTRSRGVAERVIFAGFRGDLDRLFPAFDVFCLSSHHEGLGTSLLDAMNFGVPVVATRAGGIPEAVEDGVTGRLVPPQAPGALADELAEVLADREQARQLGRAGRLRYEGHFSTARMVRATLGVYEELF
jgi:glycosyltransferase involved in cell wall biosynthesis